MENIYVKVTQALNEKLLGCKVQKIKRDPEAQLSISYLLHPSIPREYVNDKPTYIEHEVQVDIWADYEISIHETLAKVIKAMRENGFGLVSIRADMYESGTNLLHKPILFSYIEKLNETGGIVDGNSRM